MLDLCPFAEYKPVQNWGYPKGVVVNRATFPIKAIVDHIAQGTLDGLPGWFNNPDSSDSSTFGVGLDGRIFQFTKIFSEPPWTNGIDFSLGYSAYHSDLSIDWLKYCWDRGLSPNLYCVTIEHEGFTGRPMPEPQYQATLKLHQWIIDQAKVTVDANHIIGHNRVDAVNRPYCPGLAFPWQRLFADLRAGDWVTPPSSTYEPLAWSRMYHAAQAWLACTSNDQRESECWSNIYGAAQFLFKSPDPHDIQTGNKLMTVLTMNKDGHGAQSPTPMGPMSDDEAVQETMDALTDSKVYHGAQ